MVRDDDRDAAAERHRRALYRRDATGADVVAYLDRRRDVEQGSDDRTASAQVLRGRQHAGGSRRGRAAWIVAAGAILAILVVGGSRFAPDLVDARPSPSASRSVVVERPPVLARDAGPQQYARGDAERVAQGRYRYTIASGDTAIGVPSRFHVCRVDVDDALPADADNAVFAPGTVLKLALDQMHVSADGTVDCP